MSTKYKDLEGTIQEQEEIENLKEELVAVISGIYDYHVLEDNKVDSRLDKLCQLIVKESKQVEEEYNTEDEEAESSEEDLEFTDVDQFYSPDE